MRPEINALEKTKQKKNNIDKGLPKNDGIENECITVSKKHKTIIVQWISNPNCIPLWNDKTITMKKHN